MKKIISLILALLLIIITLPLATALNYNGFVYVDNGDGTCSITGYNDFYAEDVVIPSKIDGLTVISITGFRQKNSIRYVSIPSTVTEIGDMAFYSCKKLYSVAIGTGVKTIGEKAFNGCVELTSVNLRNTEHLGDYAFYGCSKLEWVDCGTALKHIGTIAFWSDKMINYIKFAPTLETIGDYAFSNCELLPSLVFPDSLKSIGTSAFSNCIAIEALTFGTGELEIGAYAFENCILLTEVTIPENVTYIGRNAFAFRETDSTVFTHTVKINCHLGSAGVDYSVRNNAPVYIIELDRTINSFGDIDGDGDVTTLDAKKALRLAAKMNKKVTDDMLLLGDLNQNGRFDVEDANIILQRATGIV